MHAQAQITGQVSGQVTGQVGGQLSGLAQQNGNSLASQVSNHGSIRRLWHTDVDIPGVRRHIIEKILQVFQRHPITPEWQQLLPKFVKHIDECLFKDATSKEEYMDSNSLERRLQIMVKRFQSPSSRNQNRSHHNPPSVGTMIPTPGLQQNGNLEIWKVKGKQSAKRVEEAFEDLGSCNMEEDGLLCPPINQVAGHYAAGGNTGPLVDKAGRFYKPLQNNQRGQHEVEFYKKFWADQTIPSIVQDLFPRFYGTKSFQASDGTGMCEYAVIEDLTYQFHQPSVIDIKMGSRTWYPGATEEYIKKCLDKDVHSTSALLGFRISGLQVYETTTKATWKPGKEWCNVLSTEEVRLALKRFVSTNPFSETDPDCSLASLVYGDPGGVLSQLLELKAWFEEQTCFHFSSASILLIYEADSTSITKNPHRSGVSVKLVDFAHVMNGQKIIDHNFLGGLCSLIKVISQIMADLIIKLPQESLLTT